MIKRIRQKMVVFDLDGTLIDTAPDLIESAWQVIKEIIEVKLDYETSRKFIGKGGEYFIKKHLEYNKIELPREELDNLISQFLRIYKKNISKKSRPYPGADKLLAWLQENDFIISICTNKPEELAKLVLSKLRIIDYFDEIIGGDTLSQSKPNPLPLLSLMSKFNIKPNDTLMVGDTTTDILTAKNCNVRCACVDFGYFDEKIEGIDPDYWISDLSDVRNIIEGKYY